jgi:DNA-binding NtrC family response regulator
VNRKLLVIDDDEASCRLVSAIFHAVGIDVVAAADGPSGLVQLEAARPDLVLLDLRLPGVEGLDLLDEIKAARPALPVVMLTAYQDIKSAVRATQKGAFDYLTKPVNDEELVAVVKRALATRALELEVEDLRQRLGEGAQLASAMGPSPEVRHLIEQVRTVAASTFTVLVQGETGVGKELVAQALHRHSPRRSMPLVAVDCGAIPESLLESELFGYERGAFTGASRRKEGRFQLAEGGTVLLDEVGNLPLGLQAKLLRVLESRTVQPVGSTSASSMDVRFVAATNDDLQERVNAGLFRADLYFRLAQFTILVPPLRQRAVDVPYLAQRFMDEASVELRRPILRVSPEALDLLTGHPWPGNVRELRNVLRRAVLQTRDLVIQPETIRGLLGGTLEETARGAKPLAGGTLRQVAAHAAEAAERQIICETLRSTRGNKSQAARALHTNYKTLHVKMKQLGIRGRDFSP